MPIINITETEQTTFSAFDATENTVLIPILYYRTYTKTDDGFVYDSFDDRGVRFTDTRKFIEFIGNNYVNVDNEPDKSYLMAYNLLLQGLTVVVKPIIFDNGKYDYREVDSEGKPLYEKNLSIEDVYKILDIGEDPEEGQERKPGALHTALEEFKDRNVFNIKFVTTGGYANCGELFEYEEGETSKLVLTTSSVIGSLASDRGDAIALIEYRPIFSNEDTLVSTVNSTLVGGDQRYSTAFLPWCLCNVAGYSLPVEMPASYAYLMAYGQSVATNANWFAAAGVSRGKVPGLVKPLYEVGDALMHRLQGDYDNLNYIVNPIFNAGSYGYRVWGNRMITGATMSQFINFLNVRVLICDIKKQVYHAAMRVTFEPNDDIVWINFKTLASSPLERMKSGRGISWYKWTRDYTDQKGTLKATLTIRPIEAVESFDINVYLTDEDMIIDEV